MFKSYLKPLEVWLDDLEKTRMFQEVNNLMEEIWGSGNQTSVSLYSLSPWSLTFELSNKQVIANRKLPTYAFFLITVHQKVIFIREWKIFIYGISQQCIDIYFFNLLCTLLFNTKNNLIRLAQDGNHSRKSTYFICDSFVPTWQSCKRSNSSNQTLVKNVNIFWIGSSKLWQSIFDLYRITF